MISDMPRVSVVIPLYNKGSHIKRALTSIFSQTIQDFEVVVVDGDSTDEGPLIVKNWDDPRIKFFIQEGTGVSTARNQGVERSQAEFIAFLDADDEWENDHLETLLRLNQSFPEAGLYSTAYYRKSADKLMRIQNYVGIPEEPWEGIVPNYFKSATYGREPVLTSVVGITKKIFFEMSGFNPHTGRGEDTDLWGRIALKYRIAFSWKGKGIYHISALNRISDRIEPVEEHVFVECAEIAIKKGYICSEFEKYLKKYAIKKQLECAGLNMEAGRPDLTIRVLMKCLYKNYADITFLFESLYLRKIKH